MKWGQFRKVLVEQVWGQGEDGLGGASREPTTDVPACHITLLCLCLEDMWILVIPGVFTRLPSVHFRGY